MSRGRKATPLKVKKALGTRKDRVNEEEPNYGEFDPKASSDIEGDAYAIKTWNRLVPLLLDQDVIQESDRIALETLCFSVADYTRLRHSLNKNKWSYTTESGVVKNRPEVTVIQQLTRIIKELSAEFGLTPSSRTKVIRGKGRKKSKDENFFDTPPKPKQSRKAPGLNH